MRTTITGLAIACVLAAVNLMIYRAVHSEMGIPGYPGNPAVPLALASLNILAALYPLRRKPFVRRFLISGVLVAIASATYAEYDFSGFRAIYFQIPIYFKMFPSAWFLLVYAIQIPISQCLVAVLTAWLWGVFKGYPSSRQ